MSDREREYFGTDGIRGPANQFPLTADFAVQLGKAAAQEFLEMRENDREWPVVIIGKDTRQSCDMLEAAIAAGIASCGVDVRLAGILPTPGVARLTVEERAIFGVVISASHNPFQDNGIKFFGPDGYKLEDDQEWSIERRIREGCESSSGSSVGRISALKSAVERYVTFVRDGADNNPDLFSGLKIALDAANGASYETSAMILRSLGAEVVAFHDHPSGININVDCGCTHSEIIEELVRETGAHVGISHDGDADRVLLCDETGSVLDGDELMAIAAIGLIEKKKLKDNTLVATVMSNAGLDEAIKKAGGRVVRTGVGDRYVMEAMRKEGYSLGGEQSGHFIFHDYSTTGDGIVSAVQLLQIMREKGQPLSELRKFLFRFPQVQRNVRVQSKPAVETMKVAPLIQEIENTLGSAGRVMLRYSGTEPLLRVLIEGRDADWITEQADRLASEIGSEIGA